MGRSDMDQKDMVSQFRWELQSGLIFAIYFSVPWLLFALCSCANLCCGHPHIIGARKSENDVEFDNPHAKSISNENARPNPHSRAISNV